MSSSNKWLEDSKNFNVDFEELQSAFPDVSERFKIVFENLKYIQERNGELYRLDYKTRLDDFDKNALDELAQWYRQIVAELLSYLEQGKTSSSGSKRLIDQTESLRKQTHEALVEYRPILLDKQNQGQKSTQDILTSINEIYNEYLSPVKKDANIRDRLTYAESSYRCQLDKWALRRAIWLFILAGMILIIFAILLSASSGGWWALNRQIIEPINNVGEMAMRKLILIPLLTVPLIGFVFANRNYRINSNLAELYTHRRISLSLLMAIMDSKAYNGMMSSEDRVAFVKEASEAIFKYYPSGHLPAAKDHEKPLITQLTSIGK